MIEDQPGRTAMTGRRKQEGKLRYTDEHVGVSCEE
jgi:hypothetical protein